MKKLRLWMGMAAVAIVSALVLAEGAALGFFYQSAGAFYYTHQPKAESLVPPAYQAPEAVFHPYYGFIHRAGRANKEQGWGTNNMGFQVATVPLETDARCCDYPMPRKPGELLVGIFGGSVAGGFALIAQRSDTLRKMLSEIPAYRGRTIRILNFAMPGFKQPQQLVTLAYFYALGQELDIVVEMDGFNEVVTTFRNWEAGVEPAFPADSLWGAWGRHLEQAAAAGPGSASQYLASYYRLEARKWERRAQSCGLALCHVAARLVAKAAAWRQRSLSRAEQARTDKVSYFPTQMQSSLGPGLDIFAYTAERWRDSSAAMADLVRQRGAVYLHVIQPNQWWKAAGEYRPIALDHIYRWVIEPVNKGYVQFESRMPQLKAAGVDVLDATLLFKGQPDRRVYIDDCCHYTDAGNEMLMEAVARAVADIHLHGRAPRGR